ncbi:MAG: lytic transglycosylase domain-containing protein [Thermoanaerobaculia bacterium]
MRRRWILVAAALVVLAALALLAVRYGPELTRGREEAALPAKPEAPPDLAKFRDQFRAGVEAAIRGDGGTAVQQLSSFHFGSRAVEEYRLYYLANGYTLAGNGGAARSTLARLWRRNPSLVHAADAGFNLADMHMAAGALRHGANVYARIARKTEANPPVAATARWQELESRFVTGDLAGLYDAARLITIRGPRAPQAADAVAVLRALSGIPETQPLVLPPSERLERALSLLRDGDAKNALQELNSLEPSAPAALRLPVQLNRGIALYQLRRYEDSTQVLEPLTSGYFRYAIPAIYTLTKNYRIGAASIDPTVKKTIVEKKKVGTVKVRVGKGKNRKTVTRPKFQNVKRTIELVDLAKKTKKDGYERLAVERLKDLLLLPLSDTVRLEVLNTLLESATAKDQEEYVMELVSAAVKIDPNVDPALQFLWNKGWGAYTRGDLAAARRSLKFIADTYGNPNVKRQSEYWHARTIERQGEKEEATATYQRLASAPYADLYAMHAISRGARRQEPTGNPLEAKQADWREIAEKEMPRELRLAYELTALSDFRDARLEIQKNQKLENQRYADALLSDIYHSTNSPVLMYMAIRRAFPKLATVEQDTVPPYFLKMYYPVKYQDDIEKYAEKNGVDPHLVMGLILQESYYNPEAKSRVGATGLMQIMPPTGKELAQRLRIPFAASRLENPSVNIQLGTFYLRRLIDLFGGSPYLAVASYNGGQGNVMRWRRASPGKPLDEFLESIPFPETRNYVKRVTILRSSYSRIAR